MLYDLLVMVATAELHIKKRRAKLCLAHIVSSHDYIVGILVTTGGLSFSFEACDQTLPFSGYLWLPISRLARVNG